MARKTTNASTSKPRTPGKKKAAAPSAVTPTPRTEQTFASHKPVVRTGTWLTIIVLAALIGLAIYLNRQKDATAADATPVSAPSFVFTSEDGLPSSIEIKPADGDAVRLARDEKNAWALELPEKAEADQGQAEAAASQISALSILGEVNAAPDIFGLDQPAYVITIKFTGGSQHVLEIGDITPTQSGYYVRVDKKKMAIVDVNGIEAMLNLVFAPPYLSTPTPSPTPLPPTETAAPEINVTATPTP